MHLSLNLLKSLLTKECKVKSCQTCFGTWLTRFLNNLICISIHILISHVCLSQTFSCSITWHAMLSCDATIYKYTGLLEFFTFSGEAICRSSSIKYWGKNLMGGAPEQLRHLPPGWLHLIDQANSFGHLPRWHQSIKGHRLRARKESRESSPKAFKVVT